MSMAVPELLAPAGGIEEFFTALNVGADAVYLGLHSFSARKTAKNFSLQQLQTLVWIAHEFSMKVYVTLNTVVWESEMAGLWQVLQQLSFVDVDAIIIQDLGLLALLKAHFPHFTIHASTQMAIHNVEGVKQAAQLGLQRIVLARELSVAEIRKIYLATRQSKVEIEIFCHGSLCYSYSGLCLFGGLTAGRSGNRGECTYFCRQAFTAQEDQHRSYPFNMKDLDSTAGFAQLLHTGVHCLKIEGRKKDAQYVASVVRYYRGLLNKVFGRNTLRPGAPETAHAFLASRPKLQDLANAVHYGFRRRAINLSGHLPCHSGPVIDQENTTHWGLPLGKILAKTKTTLTVQLDLSIGAHDGLALLWQQQKVAEFSLRPFLVDGKTTFHAQQGALVVLPLQRPLPAKLQTAPVQSLQLFKVRSNQLLQESERLRRPPANLKLRPKIFFHGEIKLLTQGPEVTCLEFSFQRLHYFSFTAQYEVATGPVANQQMLVDNFSVLGEINVFCPTLQVTVPIFTTAVEIKRIKKQLQQDLQVAMAKTTSYLAPVVQRQTTASVRKFRQLDLNQIDDLARQLVQYSPAQYQDLIIALPPVIRTTHREKLQAQLQFCYQRDLRNYSCANLAHFLLLQEIWGGDFPHLRVIASPTLYAHNAAAVWQLQQLGCQLVALPYEMPKKELLLLIKKIPNKEVLLLYLHPRPALFTTAHGRAPAKGPMGSGNNRPSSPADDHTHYQSIDRKHYLYRQNNYDWALYPEWPLDCLTQEEALGVGITNFCTC